MPASNAIGMVPLNRRIEMGYIPEIGKVTAFIRSVQDEGNQCWGGCAVTYDREPFRVIYGVRYMGNTIAGFTLSPMTCGSGILLSTGTFVNPPHDNCGIAQGLMPLKEAIAREFKYSILMATVNMNNKAEVHILEKFEWKLIQSFISVFTKNKVGIFTKDLK